VSEACLDRFYPCPFKLLVIHGSGKVISWMDDGWFSLFFGLFSFMRGLLNLFAIVTDEQIV
jgi:hypothetical protein